MKKLVASGLLLAMLCTPAYAGPNTMHDFAVKTAEAYELSPELVLAVIDQESSWNTKAVSSANCHGLMQLNQNTGKWCADQIGIQWKPYDYRSNIECGCFYLKYLHDEYAKADICEEDLVFCTLIAYNRGISGANRWMAKNDMYKNKYATSVLEKKYRMEREKYGN